MSKKSPYRYYRVEARELLDGLHAAALELEKSPAERGPRARILRMAHTLKGAARVVKHHAAADLAHGLEDLVAPWREASEPFPGHALGALSRILNELDAALRTIEGLPDPAVPETRGAREEPAAVEARFETVRVDIGELDTLLESVAEATVQVVALRRAAASVVHARQLVGGAIEALATHRRGDEAAAAESAMLLEQARAELAQTDLGGGLDRAEIELHLARARTDALRLVPAGTVLATLERAARDVARALGKQIDVVSTGGEHRLDGHVLAPLSGALLHLVRNAVDHGLESERERVSAGKALAGRLELSVERRGGRVVFACDDDGRGLDAEAIRRAAVQSGRVSAEAAAALAVTDLAGLLLHGGITTTERVSDVSGRGIGLDAVRDTVARLKGAVTLRTQPGRGTRVELSVPISLSSMRALVVEAGAARACIPLDAVQTTLRVTDRDVARTADVDHVLHGDRMVPVLWLSTLFAKGRSGRGAWPMVIVQARSGAVAVAVEALVGIADIVVRSLPRSVPTAEMIAGTTFDADGDPQPVLDADGLLDGARRLMGRVTALEVPGRPRILVVDDSLTTRMLEQSILELAGYDVDLATSGEEALAKARVQHYALFVIDVEMPGMNGFELVEHARADPELRGVPSILVTSLDTPEHRQRGADVGARAYIAKGEFHQDHFLDTIRRLVRVGPEEER